MYRNIVFFSAALLLVAFSISSCGPKPAANAQEAIQVSKEKGTVEQQVDYLVAQGKAFLNSKDYDQAITVAKHVISNLDQNSQAAQDIIEKATADMKKVAETAVKDMKGQLGIK